jgi:hypothetical protein
MSKLLEKPILRILPVFYRQATATTLRRVVFAVFLYGAMIDAFLTLRDWRRNGASLLLCVFGFILSLCLSLLVVGLIAMVWEWLSPRFRVSTRN